MPEPPEHLAGRLAALADAVRLAEGRLGDAIVGEAREVLDNANERLARGPQTVVAALGGGTGSGKSALFNALAGAPLSPVGPTRPVTGEVAALAVGEPDAAAEVLDWLGVMRRHDLEGRTPQPSPGRRDVGEPLRSERAERGDPPSAGGVSLLEDLDGLVLLDLPDQDSVRLDHHHVVDRFVQRVDVLIWVVDPLKYAQRALHDVYLRRLAAHAKVLLVVLNHVDEVSPGDRDAILRDLRRLLAEEGLGAATVLATSARTGEGVPALRDRLARLVAERRAVSDRIDADLRTVAARMLQTVGADAGRRLDSIRLVAALGVAAGIGPLADSGARSYREDADDATRPLLTGLLLRRLRRLRPRRRTRLPPMSRQDPSPIAVRHAVLDLADAAARGLPQPWPPRLHELGRRLADDVPAAVAKGLDRVDVHGVRRRRWWPLVAAVGTLLELATLVGLLWLMLLAVLAWLQLPEPPTPDVGALPWPTLLALGGGLLLLVFGVLRRRLVAAGARRHRARMLARLRAAVAEAADEQVLVPLQAELAAHRDLADALGRVGGRLPP